MKEYAKEKLSEFYYNSFLYAPDVVLIEMKKFIKDPTETNFMKTAISMRKDLWKKKTKINIKELSLELGRFLE